MLDPTSNVDRTLELEAHGSVPGGGRRKFGDACLAGDHAAPRAPNPQFLRHEPDGLIACQILLLPGFELNELSALTEAFECANRLLCERLFDWHLASLDGKPVRSAGGFTISVSRAIANSEHRHLFLLAAYGGANLTTSMLSALLCRRYATGTRIAAIGSACALLAEAGLLAARPCAAHWSLADTLAERAQSLEIADRLYAIDDRIATCAGRDATLDFALRLIADTAGERLARIVADSLNHARPREAGERQLSELDFSGQRGASPIAHTVAAMRRRMTEGEDLAGIATDSGVSQRQLQRLFRRHLGMTPTQYFLKARLQRARHMLQYSTLSVTEIAIATGFASISHFTRRYTELYGRTPTAERGRTPRRSRNTPAVSKSEFALERSAA
jgi:AraC family transcriptional regulator, glycine betaine-responsive activator